MTSTSDARPESPAPGPRKRLRVGHVSERSAVNAVRTLLEDHGLVVVEVDGRSDYGRDLIVDITEGREITGAVIGVQAKGDKRYVVSEPWELPSTAKDRRYWADSTVPLVGVLQDPDSKEMRWANLTAFARQDPSLSEWPPGGQRREAAADPAVIFRKENELNDDTLPAMIQQMRQYLHQTSAPALLGLFDGDDERRRRAIFDCWTIGRTDPRAFLLLRWALLSLQDASLAEAIITLSHLTPHPDIAWHADNWVPSEVKRQVVRTFRWSATEVYTLVHAVEQAEDPWRRGGLGQCLWCLLIEDPALSSTVPAALNIAMDAGDLDVAFRLLVIHQYGASEPLDEVLALLELYPTLRAYQPTGELLDILAEYGHVDIY